MVMYRSITSPLLGRIHKYLVEEATFSLKVDDAIVNGRTREGEKDVDLIPLEGLESTRYRNVPQLRWHLHLASTNAQLFQQQLSLRFLVFVFELPSLYLDSKGLKLR